MKLINFHNTLVLYVLHFYYRSIGGGDLRTAVLSLFLALIFVIPFSITSYCWDSLTSQIVPDDIAERPPQVSYGEDFDDDIFTRENFYDRSAGTRQYRRAIRAPQKSMNFEVYNPEGMNFEVYTPATDPETVTEEPSTEAEIVNKDGKAVTVISISKEPEAESETQ